MRDDQGGTQELGADSVWRQSEGLEEARQRDRQMLLGDPNCSPMQRPYIQATDAYGLAHMLQAVQEATGRFDPFPPEGLLEKPKLPPHWQYFTLSEEGKLVSVARRDLNGENHNCQTLNDNSDWVWSPYLIEYHIGFEHFHDLEDITDNQAARLLKELEHRLRDFTAPTEPTSS